MSGKGGKLVQPGEEEIDKQGYLSASSEVVENKRVVSDFLLQNDFFRARFLGSEGVSADIALRDALTRFDEYVSKLGLCNSPFLNLDVAKADFVERFRYFVGDVDRRIESLNVDLQKYEGVHDFPLNWEKMVREVCYYCFFVHYGAKRRGQKDFFGRPQDYVYHVLRTAFDKLIKVVGFPKFKHFIVALMHDAREDFHKGFFAVLSSTEENLVDYYNHDSLEDPSLHLERGRGDAVNLREPIMGEMFSFEDEMNTVIGVDETRELSLSECVDIVTKGGNNRDIAFLEIQAKIYQYDADGVSEDKLVDAICVSLIKIADRLENTESDDSEKNMDQTRFAYLPLCVDMGMWKTLGAFYDLLYKVDYEFRRKWNSLLDITDIDEGGEGRVTEEFLSEFGNRLREQQGFENVEYGRDYVIELIPVGIRYADYDDALEMTAHGDYTKAMRSYVRFYPKHKDPSMVKAAVRVFKSLFPRHLTGKRRDHYRRPELRNLLGKVVLADRGGVALDKNGYSDEYGVGIWGVDTSQRDSIRKIDGDPHLVTFYEGGDVNFAKDRLLRRFKRRKPEVDRLLRQYKIYLEADGCDRDEVHRTSALISKILKLVRGVMSGEYEGSDRRLASSVAGILETNEMAASRWSGKFLSMLGGLVMAIFMKKEGEIDVEVNGRLHTIALPKGVPEEDAIVWAEPLMVGRRFSYSGRMGAYEKRFVEGRVRLVFKVLPQYDDWLAHGQTSRLHSLLDDYRGNLLEDDVVRRRGAKLSSKRRRRRRRVTTTGSYKLPKK